LINISIIPFVLIKTRITGTKQSKEERVLKEIAELCKIDKKLSSHIARHTFATTVALSNDVPIESVSKMLGHTNIRAAQHYTKVLDIKIGADMALVNKKSTSI